ncbi:MAG: bifunctional diaminohydroxyphosphoribosylaminopyrimidine deaminase/5-amino-6-(5-phosphoribosylamino)uracil reductase RibD [Polyangia bacterium]
MHGDIGSAPMVEAIELARRSRPSPNPRVGAVLVKDGAVVGRGFHRAAGLPHAEIEALCDAKGSARGADLFVTLEPCCHTGRTRPCTEAIIAARPRRVVVGTIDPDPRVDGNGIRALREAGLEVLVGVEGRACRELIADYAVHRIESRPLVTLKAAATLDGKLATTGGESKWITSRKSRTLAHQLRADSDAVLVGRGTVLADDPLLTVRLAEGDNPLRIVLDSDLSITTDSRLLGSAGDAGLLLAHTGGNSRRAAELSSSENVETLACEADERGRVEPRGLLRELGKRSLLSLLVEGGPTVHGSFLRAAAADRVAVFLAPRLLGAGRGWLAEQLAEHLADALELSEMSCAPVGEDLLIRAWLSCSPALRWLRG